MNVSMNGLRLVVRDIENMRSLIVGLLCTYNPGDPDFTELDIELLQLREDEEG